MGKCLQLYIEKSASGLTYKEILHIYLLEK